MERTVGHTGIYAWGNRVRRQFLGDGAVVVEPRIPGFIRGECQFNLVISFQKGFMPTISLLGYPFYGIAFSFI